MQEASHFVFRLRFFPILSFACLIFFVPSILSAPEARRAAARVGLFVGEANARFSGYAGEWEMEGAKRALSSLGISFILLSEDDLCRSVLDCDLLIVPNMRCIPTRAVEGIRAFAAGGGKVLATYMSSYRDENSNRVGGRNDFQLADLFGASFYRWANGRPGCEYLVLDPDLAEDDLAARIELGRNTAMMVSPHPGSRILARWLSSDGKTLSADRERSSAIVENSKGTCIYVGENLFAPENSSSPQVRGLIAKLLNRLIPGTVDVAGAGNEAREPFSPFPRLKIVPLPTAGARVTVGLGKEIDEAWLICEGALRVANGGDLQLRHSGGLHPGIIDLSGWTFICVRPVRPYLKSPYIALYDQGRHLLGRTGGEIVIEPLREQDLVGVIFPKPNGTYRGSVYRGRICIQKRGDGLLLVNDLGIEEYICGVVPNEMPAFYPEEALKAMAVIARTFALSRIGRHRNEGFDLCAQVHCQVYGGAMTESPHATAAVRNTAGEFLLFKDTYADVTFHSTCGGVGENIEEIWKCNPAPYLVGKADAETEIPLDLRAEMAFRAFIDSPPESFCKDSSRFRWEEVYTAAQLEEAFQASLPKLLPGVYRGLGELKTLRVLERTSHGRVKCLEIEGSKGTYRIGRDATRWLFSGGKVGLGGLQSALFYIEESREPPGGHSPLSQPPSNEGSRKFIFRGGGWGHGVGMCQEGAAGMARRGYDYRMIMQHYYPGTSLKKR